MASARRLRSLADSLRSEANALREDADAARTREVATAKKTLASELERDAESTLAGARCLERHSKAKRNGGKRRR